VTPDANNANEEQRDPEIESGRQPEQPHEPSIPPAAPELSERISSQFRSVPGESFLKQRARIDQSELAWFGAIWGRPTNRHSAGRNTP